jgi:hypothetical protein
VSSNDPFKERAAYLMDRPKPLELTAADELLAIDNVDVLRRNGFEMEIDDSPPDGGSRLKLLAQPVSKATVFDMRGEVMRFMTCIIC